MIKMTNIIIEDNNRFMLDDVHDNRKAINLFDHTPLEGQTFEEIYKKNNILGIKEK